MRRVRRTAAAILGVAVLAVACAKAPYTNRSQLMLIPDAKMQTLGKQAYQDVVAKSQPEKGTADAKRLGEVGRHIAAAADKPDYDWHTTLLRDPQVNAFCLPGGYIAFYTGVLPVLKNEAGMAFVMGHETGHAIARHGAERLSEQLGVSGALSLIDMVLQGGTGMSARERNLVMGALGVGAQVGVLLPFSRTQEKEADIIGLMLMSDAGYPPKVSLGVWDRMSAVGGKAPPVWLSTHPSDEQRMATMKQYLPEALKHYARSQKAPSATTAVW